MQTDDAEWFENRAVGYGDKGFWNPTARIIQSAVVESHIMGENLGYIVIDYIVAES